MCTGSHGYGCIFDCVHDAIALWETKRINFNPVVADKNCLEVIKALGGRFVTYQRRITFGYPKKRAKWDTADCVVFQSEAHDRFATEFLIEPHMQQFQHALDAVTTPPWPDPIRIFVPYVIAEPSPANIDHLLVLLTLTDGPYGF